MCDKYDSELQYKIKCIEKLIEINRQQIRKIEDNIIVWEMEREYYKTKLSQYEELYEYSKTLLKEKEEKGENIFPLQ